MLSEGAEKCGGPLCDKLYLNFQGSAYLTYASSKFGGSSDGGDDRSCDILWSCEYIDLPEGSDMPIGRRLQEADAMEVTAGSTITVSEDGSAVKRTLSKRVMHRLVERTGLDRGGCLPAPKRRSAPAPVDTTGPARGLAIVISGAFTVTSLESDVGYSGGMLEYVPRFDVFPPECESGLPAELHYVRPDAVRLMFTRSRRSE